MPPALAPDTVALQKELQMSGLGQETLHLWDYVIRLPMMPKGQDALAAVCRTCLHDVYPLLQTLMFSMSPWSYINRTYNF